MTTLKKIVLVTSLMSVSFAGVQAEQSYEQIEQLEKEAEKRMNVLMFSLFELNCLFIKTSGDSKNKRFRKMFQEKLVSFRTELDSLKQWAIETDGLDYDEDEIFSLDTIHSFLDIYERMMNL